MKPFKFRASSLGRIMANAQSIDPALLTDELAAISRKTKKTDEEKALLLPLQQQSLSAGAKTYCEEIAGEFVYGYESVVTGKYLEKGLLVEPDALELFNIVNFTEYEKNTERRTNEWITGECDVQATGKIVDLKSSWSLETFPKTAAKGRDVDYEWQGRAYMMLWDEPRFDIAYCMVNTPEHLIGYEDPTLHSVDHINPALRVTCVPYVRDLALEDLIKIKCEAANRYITKIVQQIAAEHGA